MSVESLSAALSACDRTNNRFTGPNLYNSLLNKHYVKSQVHFMFYFTERKEFHICHIHSRINSSIQALWFKLATNYCPCSSLALKPFIRSGLANF